MDKESTVLVYGTNLAGYRTSYALAKMGHKVVMLNKGSYVDQYKGQVLAQLPLGFCWACGYVPQRLFTGLGAMQIFYNADLLEVSGKAGNFNVKLKKKDPYVNHFACTECEACIRACPIEVQNNGTKHKAIHVLPKVFWENIFIIDEERCTKCGECEKVCPTSCLKLEREEEVVELNVGAIVLAPEFDDPGPKELFKFGFSTLPNVVKSSDLTRSSLLTGPVRNSLERPSDGNLPRKVGVIVTPHYTENKDYESHNCSISAIYRAYKIKELMHEAEISVFLREFRGFGKGHYRWYEKALEAGVKVIKAKKLEVKQAPGNNVEVQYMINGSIKEVELDLLIMTTGQKPPSLMDKLSKLTGIEADEHGFCKALEFSCGRTTREGIFAVGEFTGPKGNPETVWEGYGTATEVLEFLGKPNIPPAPPPPRLRDMSKEMPKGGAFICSCFGEFNNAIDLESLTKKVKELPGVVHAQVIRGCCTPHTIEETAKNIKESGVNRVVLAVCTPCQKREKFRRTVMMGGLNPLLAEFLAFREDVIRVHKNKEAMEEKALALIASAFEKLKRAQPAPPPTNCFHGSALVIGGGAAGMEAALTIASRGFPVAILEKNSTLGGLALSLERDLEGRDIYTYVNRLIEKVENHPNIAVYKKAQIEDLWGYAGHYYAKIRNLEDNSIIQAGIVILATGAKQFDPKGLFLYGKNGRVLTQMELQKKMKYGEVPSGRVAMVQCVGSRNKDHPYCSRFCCSQAIKNALVLSEKGAEITILYRDLNIYGFKEDYYRKAIKKGIQFIRFDSNAYPQIKAVNGGLEVSLTDTGKGSKVTLNVKTLVLSTGIVPDLDNNKMLADLLDYRLDSQGFFETDTSMYPYEEATKKLMKPWELSSNAIYPVGLAHSPRFFTESLLTARDAAGRSLTILGKKRLPPPNAMFVSAVKKSKCMGCGLCTEVCPYYAREIDKEKGVAIVRPFLCDACGACTVVCPSKAAYLKDARGEQMIPSIDALLS